MIEKKLVLCGILAIVIGIATIVPLAFFMSAKAQTSPEDQPQFNFDLPYAYIGNYWDNNTTPTDQTYGWVFALAFRTSPNFDLSTMNANVVYETYRAEVSSEKGPVGNITLSTFAKSASLAPMNFSIYLGGWYNFTDSKDASGQSTWENGTAVGFKNGFGENWNRSQGAPETLYITVYRDNWILVNENSTVIHQASPEAILRIQLQRYHDGFLYNTAIPQNELDQINPLFPAQKMLN